MKACRLALPWAPDFVRGNVPEFLSPELVSLRDRATVLATDVLVPLRDDPQCSPAERAARVREASVSSSAKTSRIASRESLTSAARLPASVSMPTSPAVVESSSSRA